MRAASPSAAVGPIRQVIRDLDPALPVSSVATIEELVSESLQQPRGLSFLITVLGTVALVLSVIGIYGVMAYYVQQHAKDITIRMALGGSRGDVMRLVVARGMRLVAVGILIGLVAGVNAARLIRTLLFGVEATDPKTFVAVTATMGMVALLACTVPALRAVAMDPAEVLRAE